MANAFYKSPRFFSILFILSVPISYFSIWAGAIILSGDIAAWMSPILLFRLFSYALIMTLGMIMFHHFMFRKTVSIVKLCLSAFIAPFIIFMVMALFDSATYPILFGGSFSSHLPERISIYLTRFYVVGAIAAMVSGLLYYMSFQAKRVHDTYSVF